MVLMHFWDFQRTFLVHYIFFIAPLVSLMHNLAWHSPEKSLYYMYLE